MSNGKHSATQVMPLAPPEPKRARVAGRADADSDVVSVMREWLDESHAHPDIGRAHYRRPSHTEDEVVAHGEEAESEAD